MGQVWGQILVSIQELPSAAEWGWRLSSDRWKPTWTTLPEASNTCNELIGDFASVPRQTCPALHCALAVVIPIKILKKNCQVRFCRLKLLIA